MPSNGLVTVMASTGQISEHQEQFTQVSSAMNVLPVISGFGISSLNIHVEQICLIAFSGQTLLHTPHCTHFERSTSIELFNKSTLDVGLLVMLIASAGHKSAQKEQ